MKINAIGADYAASRALSVKKAKEIPEDVNNIPKGMSMISFRSGNPRHIAHIVEEEPLFGLAGGGVGTVSNDYNYLDKDVDKVIKIIPMYNQDVDYKKDVDPKTGKVRGTLPQGVKVRYIPKNLPADHPFKAMEGQPFITSVSIGKDADLAKVLKDNANKIFILEEVKSSSMDWGMHKDVPIKMFKAKKDSILEKAMSKKGYTKEQQKKLEFVFTYVDSISSMEKPYDDKASYASATAEEMKKRFATGWEGQPYAKKCKAIVELLPSLKEKYNLDPKYILCSDGQSQFTMHYAAMKNAAGDPYWLDKFLGGVGHNMNRGYAQEMGARQAIVNLGATKEQIEKLVNSEKYIEALRNGEEEKFLTETVLKNFYNKEAGMNAFMIPIHYGKKGYVPMLTTVSEGYHDSIITNEFMSPLKALLAELDTLGRFKGLTNPLMDPQVTGFKYDGLQDGYKKDTKLKLANGQEVTVPKFQIFDSAKKYDLKHIRDIKHQNKINLFERLSSKYIGAQYYDSEKGAYLGADTGRMHILTGASNRKAKIHGEISEEYIKKLKANKDVKLIVSWGRGDLQKALDTVVDSFEKYAKKDPDAVLVLGGPIDEANSEAVSALEKFKMKSLKPELKGRMVFMEGFAPGKDFAIAGDVALLPSRFAPCELTDLEAKKYLCTPIVPNVGGMAQKNFDPSIPEEASKMDAYKGKHEYYITEEEALKSVNEDAKKEFEAAKGVLVKEMKTKYRKQVNEEMPEELIKKYLEGDDKYDKALRKLRDEVISDEMSGCLERALITDRNSKNAEQILKHQVDADTTWFGNSWLSKTGKSSGDLYQEYHFNNKGKNITKADLIQLDFSGLGKAARGSREGGNSLTTFFRGKTGKIAAAVTLGVAALGSLGYYGYKKDWFSPKFEKEEAKSGELSCVG